MQIYRVRLTEYHDIHAETPEAAIKQFRRSLTRTIKNKGPLQTFVVMLDEDPDGEEIELEIDQPQT